MYTIYMIETKLYLALIAAGLALMGNIPYLRQVIKKRVQPHPFTWLVWSTVSLVTFFGQLVKGAGVGVIPTAVSELFTVVIFLFSLKYGFRNVDRRDVYFLITALLGFVPWILTKDPTISVIIVVGIDVLAFVPTIRKSWRRPASEAPLLYGTNVLRHCLALFSLEAYNIATTLHSIAMILTNTCMTVILKSKLKK